MENANQYLARVGLSLVVCGAFVISPVMADSLAGHSGSSSAATASHTRANSYASSQSHTHVYQRADYSHLNNNNSANADVNSAAKPSTRKYTSSSPRKYGHGANTYRPVVQNYKWGVKNQLTHKSTIYK